MICCPLPFRNVTVRIHNGAEERVNQSKAMRMIVNAPRYVPNTVIRRDHQILTVKEEIRRYSPQYSARLCAHPMT
jgi:hypothetical protein